MNGGWGISYEIALRWMPLDLTDDKSTLVQVMAWCCQATSHYLGQCWPRSMSPNGITRPQWVDSFPLVLHICIGELGHHWFRQWCVACSAPSHYLNQCWLIVNWTPGKKFSVKFESEFYHFLSRKFIRRCCLPNGGHLSKGRWVNWYVTRS